MRQINDYKRQAEYHRWLSYLDKYLPLEAEKLKALSEKELSLAFENNLEFGTGGLRGTVGWGPSLINTFTIKRATAGFAKYISENQAAKSVLIAYDTRKDSQAFARAAAGVMLKKNVEVYLFNAPTATPILSYGIRKLKIGWGIVITASHNPKEYNGYKCYDARGVQLLPLPCQEIMNNIKNIAAETVFGIETVADTELETHPLFHILGDELTDRYLKKLFKSLPNTELTLNEGNELGIVYSPLHGCGAVPVPKILRKQGFGNCHFLQTEYDHEFGGIKTPNPEEPTVYDKAIRLAQKKGCQLILTTDPDSDRTGVCICEKDNSRLLTGNQVAALLMDYLTTVRNNSGKALVTTVVSGEMAQVIARERDIKVYLTLTGFKYIGDLAQKTPVCLGYEESCGYMTSNLGGDKDGIEAAALIAEMTLYHLQHKRTLYDRWLELGEQYGYYVESQLCQCTDTNSFEKYRQKLLEKLSPAPFPPDSTPYHSASPASSPTCLPQFSSAAPPLSSASYHIIPPAISPLISPAPSPPDAAGTTPPSPSLIPHISSFSPSDHFSSATSTRPPTPSSPPTELSSPPVFQISGSTPTEYSCPDCSTSLNPPTYSPYPPPISPSSTSLPSSSPLSASPSSTLTIRRLEDYSEGRWYDHNNNTHGFLELRAEMIKIFFTNGCWLAVRPSGTENKIKYYFSACGKSLPEAEKHLSQFKKAITDTATLP